MPSITVATRSSARLQQPRSVARSVAVARGSGAGAKGAAAVVAAAAARRGGVASTTTARFGGGGVH